MPGTTPIAYETVNTPIGRVHLASGPRGLVAVGLGSPAARFEVVVARRTGTRPEQRRGSAGTAARQLKEYLRGGRRTFRLQADIRRMSSFQRAVLRAAARIPYGRTSTYGEIARRLGQPRSARAVGQALAANPLPLVFPCHRVVGAHGALGGYTAARGVAVKRWLLRLEQTHVR